ncbi:heptaprenyl diphosphate synthase (HEPPP synthase) subunit 1 family protein [Staphylococcus aureus]|uniref:Heptaprenyl diphosphate synthase (HEPPP synthase) subunit 1 family protein n=1 Tax=Staphylococcus aureus TaxID=1280 RepID=A0A380E312_STAAU|nr:heptaprenyl diphosphate synthase (HEPPP synthase) subunit 1 family protein [Staphylococcus aureus]
METTVSKLERQIEERLKGVSEYESININHRLGKLLDSYDIPDVAKVACLTIDTSMRHLMTLHIIICLSIPFDWRFN